MKKGGSLPDPKPQNAGIWVILSYAGDVIWSLCSGDKGVDLQQAYSSLSGHRSQLCLRQILCHQISLSRWRMEEDIKCEI